MALTESYTGYCLACLRDHLHKCKGVLREAIKQWRRKGEITESIRNKVDLAEEELSSAETEHVWNVKLDDPDEDRRLKEIGTKLSKIRKVLEATQIGFAHPKIPVKGTVEDLEKVLPQIDDVMNDVYEGIIECPSCLSIEDFMKQLKQVNPQTKKGNVLNSNPHNNSNSDVKMSWKPVALTYGGQWIGKGIDKAIQYVVPQYDMPITVGLAVGLPILTKLVKMPETAEEATILVGGFLSTKIMDYIEQALAPAPVAVRRVTPRPVTAPAPPLYGQRVSPQVPITDHVRYVVT